MIAKIFKARSYIQKSDKTFDKNFSLSPSGQFFPDFPPASTFPLGLTSYIVADNTRFFICANKNTLQARRVRLHTRSFQ